MRDAASQGGAGGGGAQSEPGDRCAGATAQTPADGPPEERFALWEFVHEERRRFVGQVVTIHRPAPVLYGVELTSGGITYAYDQDVRPATVAEVAAYHDQVARRRPRARPA